jgi:hypothetical protein
MAAGGRGVIGYFTDAIADVRIPVRKIFQIPFASATPIRQGGC